MGRYYNKTRTPLAASTTKGNVITFPSRGWAYVPITEESSQSIQAQVRKGLLVRADAPEDFALLTPQPVAKLAPAPAPVVQEARSAPTSVVETPADEPKDPTDVVEDRISDESITSDVTAEVSDPAVESVALDGPSVADSQSRKPRRR